MTAEYHAQLSVLEHDYEMALGEYKSFVEFCGTFEGDEIPDNLYSVATEVYGADLARSAGAGIAKFAKKVWEIIVKLFKLLLDFLNRAMKWIVFSNKRYKKVLDALGKDRERFDHSLKTITKFVPEKETFENVRANLAILISSNHDIIEQMKAAIDQGVGPSNTSFGEALAELNCRIEIPSASQMNASNAGLELVIDDPNSRKYYSYSSEIFKKVMTEQLMPKSGSSEDWKTYDLEDAIRGLMTVNTQILRMKTKTLTNDAKVIAKEWQEKGLSEDPPDMMLIVAGRGLATVMTNIINVEMSLAAVMNNLVSRMSAYALSGALSLEDANFDSKDAGTAGDRSAFLKFNILSRG